MAAIELASIAAWLLSYKSSKSVLEKYLDGPEATAISGSTAGLTLAAITLPAGIRQFPETAYDLRAAPYGQNAWKATRMACTHSVYFCVYEGLSRHIKRKPAWDIVDYSSIAFASAVAAMAMRAASLSFYNGPVTNPVFGPDKARILLVSTLGMSFVTTSFEFLQRTLYS